jgi:hypothetical protein
VISPAVYELKISLAEVEPEVWRVFQLPASVPLRKLHKVIQHVMGWEDYHLYSFEKAGIVFGRPDPDFLDDTISDQGVALHCLLKEEGDQLTYIYDFGDNWKHELTLQRVLPDDPEMHHPVCLDGANACPPEDCGGSWGYADYLEALRDPDHEQHEECLHWRGPFDPTNFDLMAVNRKLRRLKV